jgi:hypothetical protein
MRYEYIIVDIEMDKLVVWERMLNLYGVENWQLVQIKSGFHIFKREVQL